MTNSSKQSQAEAVSAMIASVLQAGGSLSDINRMVKSASGAVSIDSLGLTPDIVSALRMGGFETTGDLKSVSISEVLRSLYAADVDQESQNTFFATMKARGFPLTPWIAYGDLDDLTPNSITIVDF